MPLIDIGPDASDAERREKQSQYLDFLDDEVCFNFDCLKIRFFNLNLFIE